MNKKQCTVSLTSHQKRFSTLPICLESLFKQTLSYDRIVLYLDNNENLKKLPNEIRHFEDMGLKIIQTDDNLGSHTKYFYAMNDFSNDIIITVDDDVIYCTFRINGAPFPRQRCKRLAPAVRYPFVVTC